MSPAARPLLVLVSAGVGLVVRLTVVATIVSAAAVVPLVVVTGVSAAGGS